MLRIESLLSARLFLTPQLANGRLYFLSNASGRLSLYAMDGRPGGSLPEPLLPLEIALQNPELEGMIFRVFPRLGKILVMIDHNGDENYQPMLIPLKGGYPEPAFGDGLAGKRVHCVYTDLKRDIAYFTADSYSEANYVAYSGNLKTGELKQIAEGKWGAFVAGVNENHSQVVWAEGYTAADNVYFHWTKKSGESKLLAGVPLDQRKEGEAVKLTAFGACHFTPQNHGLLFTTALFSDSYGLGYLSFADPQNIKPVKVIGVKHRGIGELGNIRHLKGNRYAVDYNIDGVSWLYEGAFSEKALKFTLDRVIYGKGTIGNGVVAGAEYDEASDTWAAAYSTATSPTQIYTVGGKDRKKIVRHTNERVLGLSASLLASGEDASFTSHDGLRVSARLYLPAPALKFAGPRPVVYYVHGGPQGQERPDFAWFSMPLIQFLTLNGFAVFVPNARGSSGYGLKYMKHVDRDWGGQDRLDHVYAITKVLPNDKRLNVKRAAVVGRSYGGYMTLTLAARHPGLWSAAVDMFGPYDLPVWLTRLPETWKTYFDVAMGHPERDRDLLVERSPSTYINNITAPLLVIQGKNDPRVVERESRDVVEQLKAKGKEVEYLMFEDEGHDVIKFENKVKCYNAITEFFKKTLKP